MGRYSMPNAVDVEGNRPALLELSRLLRLDVPTLRCCLRVPEGRAADPYEHFLDSILIVRRDGLVEISLAGNVLIIAGSQDGLDSLTSYITILTDPPEPPPGYTASRHSHIEYYPEHPYFAPSSLPIVVGLADDDVE